MIALLLALGLGQVPTLLRPDTAVPQALADAEALALAGPGFTPRMRYIATNTPLKPKEEDLKEVQASVGYVGAMVLNFSAEPVRPIPFGTGGVFRVDLLQLADYDQQRFRALADTWERIKDNQYHIPIDDLITVSKPRYVRQGRAWTTYRVAKTIAAHHANDGGQLDRLRELTGSQAPIVSIGQFFRFGMSTVDGNLYYDFRGIEENPERGTAEEAFLLRSGVSPDMVQNIKADQRVVLMSKVTGNWRVIEYYYVPARASVGPFLVTISRDWKRGKIEPDVHGLENLAQEYEQIEADARAGRRTRRTHDASEIFIFGPDGKLEFAIFDGAGARLDSAPPNVVTDRTVPAPHPAELDGGMISCVRCHGPQHAMFQPAVNYVSGLRNIVIDGRRWDVFKGRSNKIARLFSGETYDSFALARITHAKFAFVASANSKVEDVTDWSTRIYDSWVHGYQTTRTALRTLGYEVETDQEAVDLFNKICPPTNEPEPLRISLLRGLLPMPDGTAVPMELTTDDWLEIYPEVAVRVRAWEAAQVPQPKVEHDVPDDAGDDVNMPVRAGAGRGADDLRQAA